MLPGSRRLNSAPTVLLGKLVASDVAVKLASFFSSSFKNMLTIANRSYRNLVRSAEGVFG